MSSESPDSVGGAPEFRAALRSALAALLALAGVVGWVYQPVFTAGVDRAIAIHPVPGRGEMQLILADHRFTVWAVSRNARALVTDPADFFDAEACFPAEKSLALGEPVITMSLLGVVPYLLSGDPELTYNAAVIVLAFVGGVAMWLLVRDWTGSAAAGLAAALWYLFSRARFGEPIHPYVGDMTWALFALYFARRLFVRPRWRDALGLAAAVVLQAGTSVYPALATLLVGVPFAVWLILRHGLDRPRALRLVPVLVGAFVAGAIVASPYWMLQSTGELLPVTKIFLRPEFFFPGGAWYQGWSRYVFALIAAIVSVNRTWSKLPGDPRAALAIGAALSLFAAMGPELVAPYPVDPRWNLWTVLVTALPPLESVRTPAALALGFDMVVDVFAGIGVAGVLHALRRFGAFLPGLAVLAAAGLDGVAYRERVAYAAYDIEPAAEEIAFFDALAARGNDGPLFEWPNPPYIAHTAGRISLAAYHHRRTSSCFASQLPVEMVQQISVRDWGRDEMMRLHRIGFTTLIVHHDPAMWEEHLRLFLSESVRRDGTLHMIHTIPTMTAYAILPGRTLVAPGSNRMPPGIPALAPRQSRTPQ